MTRPSRMGAIVRPLLGMGAFGALMALGGCVSLTYVDRHNVRHVVGLVHVAVKAGDELPSRMVATTTFGLGLSGAAADESAVTLGYSRNVFLSLGKDACVDLKAAGPCAELAAMASK